MTTVLESARDMLRSSAKNFSLASVADAGISDPEIYRRNGHEDAIVAQAAAAIAQADAAERSATALERIAAKLDAFSADMGDDRLALRIFSYSVTD